MHRERGDPKFSVHVFAQAGVQLAADAAAQVSLSSSYGMLGTRLPDSLLGESDNQRLGAAGPTPFREVTSTPFADGGVLACTRPVAMICRSSQRGCIPHFLGGFCPDCSWSLRL